ncbi:MAG: PilN domain-containing protein [Desulfobacterales bacterium]|uniref:PilN domain-containing protein n=1 Tax=Candidatus Desulfaltia bathyphila TaxID=2841697 RepID=A0A8J6TAY9_9BACT|nr:PilN domain-containing protein [Candidatus Desulfaltia bathyphila]MBL7195669.1 PilN domain-containing protein [Desulfobacterales bacterium]MBL7207142.1 PilN domain-containing protein [Desulfobacterales bacterium]
MIRINLLPFRVARKKENIRRQISIFLLSLFLITMIMIYYNIRLNSKIQDLNTRTNKTTKELAQYNKINNEIKFIKKKLELLTKKTDVIKNLDLSREDAVRLLDAMTEMVVEKRMWLNILETKEKIVSIKGVALDNKTVADFMTRLEDSKLFKRVELKTTKQQKFKKTINLKSFEITCES